MAKQAYAPNFEMLRTLGCSSFGRVKSAMFKQDGKYYAVRFMKKQEIIKEKQGDDISSTRLAIPLGLPFLGTVRSLR